MGETKTIDNSFMVYTIEGNVIKRIFTRYITAPSESSASDTKDNATALNNGTFITNFPFYTIKNVVNGDAQVQIYEMRDINFNIIFRTDQEGYDKLFGSKKSAPAGEKPTEEKTV